MAYEEQWEYKVIGLKGTHEDMPKQEGRLNNLGHQGWELVAVTSEDKVIKYDAIAYLKRKKS